MTRVDPTLRMNRWYAVNVQSSLFDECAVMLTWGSRANSYQRARMLVVESEQVGTELAAQWVTRKLRRGYVRVGD